MTNLEKLKADLDAARDAAFEAEDESLYVAAAFDASVAYADAARFYADAAYTNAAIAYQDELKKQGEDQ